MVSLSEVTFYFTISGIFVALIFGTIGGILNIIVFLSKDFRKKSCIFYLICSSSSDMFVINFAAITRFTTEYFGNNLVGIDRGVCKMRGYFLTILPTLSGACILLAAFDRFASTSSNARWRQMCSISFARRAFTVAIIFFLASGSFLPIIFDIRNGVCGVLPGLQATIVLLYAVIMVFLIPHASMAVFGIMTWLNIRQSQNRILPNASSQTQTLVARRMNRQLLILVFVHVSISIVLSGQRCIAFSYAAMTSSVKKSVEQQQIEYLIQQVSVILFYLNHGIPFCLYYASSSAFRRGLRTSLEQLKAKCRLLF